MKTTKLTHPQLEVLRHMAKTGALLKHTFYACVTFEGAYQYPPSIATVEALERRGMIQPDPGATERERKWSITELGKLSIAA